MSWLNWMYSLQLEQLQYQMEHDYEIGYVDYFFFAWMVSLVFIHFYLDLCLHKFLVLFYA